MQLHMILSSVSISLLKLTIHLRHHISRSRQIGFSSCCDKVPNFCSRIFEEATSSSIMYMMRCMSKLGKLSCDNLDLFKHSVNLRNKTPGCMSSTGAVDHMLVHDSSVIQSFDSNTRCLFSVSQSTHATVSACDVSSANCHRNSCLFWHLLVNIHNTCTLTGDSGSMLYTQHISQNLERHQDFVLNSTRARELVRVVQPNILVFRHLSISSCIIRSGGTSK